MSEYWGCRPKSFMAAFAYALIYVEEGLSARPFEEDGAWKVQIFRVSAIERYEHLPHLDKEFRFRPAGQMPKKRKRSGRPRKEVEKGLYQ